MVLNGLFRVCGVHRCYHRRRDYEEIYICARFIYRAPANLGELIRSPRGVFNEAFIANAVYRLIGFGELIGDGVLFKDIADSLVRFFIGYLISVVAGVFFGPILGGIRGFGTTSIQSFKSFDQLLCGGCRLSFFFRYRS